MGREFAYIRPLNENENLSRQMKEYKKFGICNEYVYSEPEAEAFIEYLKLIDLLEDGDVVYIKSLKVLGRDAEEIMKRWTYIKEDKGATVKVLNMFMMDTSKWLENGFPEEEMIREIVK